MADEQQFQPADAEEILRQAVRLDLDRALSKQDLIRNAQELGVSEEAVEAAIERLHRQRQQSALAEDDEKLRRQWLQHRRAKRLEEIGGMLSVCVLLAGINLLTSGLNFSKMFSWSVWPIGIMLAITLCQLVEFAFKPATEEEFQRYKSKRQKPRSSPPDDADE